MDLCFCTFCACQVASSVLIACMFAPHSVCNTTGCLASTSLQFQEVWDYIWQLSVDMSNGVAHRETTESKKILTSRRIFHPQKISYQLSLSLVGNHRIIVIFSIHTLALSSSLNIQFTLLEFLLKVQCECICNNLSTLLFFFFPISVLETIIKTNALKT